MFLIVKRYTYYINHLLNHISHIAVKYGEVRINPDSINYFCYRKKAIRIIYNLNYHDQTSVFFHSSKILKLHDLITYKIMIILYKANNHSLNGRVQAFFKPTDAIHMYGTRQSKRFNVKKQTPPSDYCHSLSKV